jgi:hypothetical protein
MVSAGSRKKQERQRKRMSRLLHGRRPSLLGRLLWLWKKGGAALFLFLALWFALAGRNGLSAEPPAVGVEGRVG